MKVTVAHLSHGKAGTDLAIWETSVLAPYLEYLGDCGFGVVSLLTFGWLYEVRWGPKDEYGIADRSVGALMFSFGQWLAAWGYRRRRHIAFIPVTSEWVAEHFPDAG
jgi:hypothetical protein